MAMLGGEWIELQQRRRALVDGLGGASKGEGGGKRRPGVEGARRRRTQQWPGGVCESRAAEGSHLRGLAVPAEWRGGRRGGGRARWRRGEACVNEWMDHVNGIAALVLCPVSSRLRLRIGGGGTGSAMIQPASERAMQTGSRSCLELACYCCRLDPSITSPHPGNLLARVIWEAC